MLLVALAAGATLLIGRLQRERQYQALITLGEQALEAGDTYRAIEQFSGALALRPDGVAAFYRRGEAYRQQRRDEEAIRDLREAIRLSPDTSQPILSLAELYDERGEPAQAAEWYAQASRQLSDDTPGVLYALALARYRAGQPATALEPLRQATAHSDAPAAAHYLYGVVLRDTGSPEAAIAALEQAVRIQPDFVAAREELAELYRVQARGTDEMRQLQLLANGGPDIDRRIDLALAETRHYQYDRALALLEEATRGAPSDSRIALAIGRVHLARAERLDDATSVTAALAALERALAGTARRSEGLALYGRALYLEGSDEDAERLLREAVSTSPVHADAFRFLADASERLGHRLAARDALVSLDILEGDAAPIATRVVRAERIGTLSAAADDWATAIDYLSYAVDAGEPRRDTIERLARAYLESGDASRASTVVARGLGTWPGDPQLLQLRSALQSPGTAESPAPSLAN